MTNYLFFYSQRFIILIFVTTNFFLEGDDNIHCCFGQETFTTLAVGKSLKASYIRVY